MKQKRKKNTLYHFYLMTVTSNLYPQVLNYALYIMTPLHFLATT